MQTKIGSAYIRVSDDRQDEYSPDSQLKLVQKYAKEHGYLIPNEYVFYDDGISAKSVRKRTQFNQMIALAKEKDHPIDAIFVWKFSRFARNQEESIVYKSLLRKINVDVISVSETIDNSPFGSLIERIIEWMDEYYLIRLSGEVRRGMMEKASRGEPVVSPPLGYDLINKKLIPNDQAEIVRYVFSSYANGEKQRAIAMDLASKGVKTTYGNRPDNRYIDYMLHNPIYIGKIRWSKEGAVSSKRIYDSDKLVVFDGKHEPIISNELWDNVQNMLNDQKKRYGKYHRFEGSCEWTFKGLLRCGSCGSTLVRSCVSSKYPGVQCSAYNRGSCTVSHFMKMDLLTESIFSGIEENIVTSSFLLSPDSDDRPKESPQVDYDRLISLEQKRLSRFKEAYSNGVDTIEEYAENKKRINAKIEKLKADQSKENNCQATIDIEAFSKKVQTVLRFVKDPSNSEKTKNESLRSIIEKIVFDKVSRRFIIYYHSFS